MNINYIFFTIIWNAQLYLQPPTPIVMEEQGQFLCFWNTLHTFGIEKNMNMSQKFRISSFISWHLHLDVLNYLEHSTFGIRPPYF